LRAKSDVVQSVSGRSLISMKVGDVFEDRANDGVFVVYGVVARGAGVRVLRVKHKLLAEWASLVKGEEEFRPVALELEQHTRLEAFRWVAADAADTAVARMFVFGERALLVMPPAAKIEAA